MDDKPRLFLLDDQADYVNAISRALCMDFEVSSSLSLEDAKRKFSADVDILLVDICLDESKPDDRSGLLFVKWVRSAFPHKPIVVVSALRDDDLPIKVLEVGANRFLRKPIQISELRSALADEIRRCSD